jgi:hypothetical protein
MLLPAAWSWRRNSQAAWCNLRAALRVLLLQVLAAQTSFPVQR